MISNPNIEPQTCKNGNIEALSNLDCNYIAQEKFDGHRAIMYIKDNKAYFYSRRTSDRTGLKEDNTERLPYLHLKHYPKLLDDTILDGELVATWDKSDSSIVQTILGSTPERAKELWDAGHILAFKAFDVISYRGTDISDLALIHRLGVLRNCKEFMSMAYDKSPIEFATIYADKNCVELFGKDLDFEFCENGYKQLLSDIQERGGEGIILKDLESPYLFKRSSAWLKFKALRTADLVIIGFVKPKKEYNGKFSVEELKERGWEYWENGEPVSKTYAKNWVAGIKLGAYKNGKLTYVTTVKGFSDEVQETIKHNDLSNVVVEVEFQDVINPNTKSLRHPRFKCFRWEKNAEDCLWEDIE